MIPTTVRMVARTQARMVSRSVAVRAEQPLQYMSPEHRGEQYSSHPDLHGKHYDHPSKVAALINPKARSDYRIRASLNSVPVEARPLLAMVALAVGMGVAAIGHELYMDPTLRPWLKRSKANERAVYEGREKPLW